MRLIFNAILLLLFPLIFLSCRKENRLDCFTPNGEEVSDVRSVGVFDEVEVFDKIDLFVYAGTSHSVVVRGGKKILHNIKTEVRDGRLYIDNHNTCNFVRGYKRRIRVDVYMPYLKFLKNSGVGPAKVEVREQDTLVVRTESSGDISIDGDYTEIRTSSHGNGDIYLKGRSHRLFIYTYGTNYVHAEDIVLRDYAFVQSLTLGDCILRADSLNQLDCIIEGDGNVYYIGQPKVVNDYTNKDQYSGRLGPKN